MVARAKEARPAPVTSELLGLTQPVVLHHVKILVDAKSFARREALRVGVLHTCPLSLGCAGRRGRGRAALPHLAFVCAGAGVTTPEAVMLLAGWPSAPQLGMGRPGFWLLAVMRPLAPGTFREVRRSWRKPVPASCCSYSAAVQLRPRRR